MDGKTLARLNIEVDLGLPRYATEQVRLELSRLNVHPPASIQDPKIRPPCFSQSDHFQSSIWYGEWALDRNLTEPFFAPDCPWFAKRNQGDWLGRHAKYPDQEEHRLVFKSEFCHLIYPSAQELRTRLANRTVIFLGDSVSLQMALALACALWKVTASDGSPSEIVRSVNGEENIVETAERSRCMRFFDSQVVCWVSAGKCCIHAVDHTTCQRTCARTLGHALAQWGNILTAADVMIANVGVHFNIDKLQDMALIDAEIEGFCSSYKTLLDDRGADMLPTMVFRESGPQLWPKGRYHYNRSLLQSCAAWPDEWFWKAKPWDSTYNPYNSMVNELLENCLPRTPARFSRLPVWFPTAQLGIHDLLPVAGDCTHYFGPGSANSLWNSMLLNLLAHTTIPSNTPAAPAGWETIQKHLQLPGTVPLDIRQACI